MNDYLTEPCCIVMEIGVRTELSQIHNKTIYLMFIKNMKYALL